ncbi:glycoside hydrolase family 32 protein [Paenibacillus sp. LHD-117]|uniref:glycoside hydrolase family 32 protein n=1 Tax=Paenibacillus sp. LHD-117 TaxID=3071412 RepID=UPI0027E10A43|nr:glycoside hydrolase family 32 protein [Paenibacillus sp. LHD-117]MDQ6420303.1 glycoside hydrolase family 32 protein [Paenibacillus sp. LHD-117]
MGNLTVNQLKHAALIDRAGEALSSLESAMDRTYRLGYHLMPPAGWMNDPNGLIQFQGVYHAFYQHDPYQSKQGPMHWGHATSLDLVHWEHQPVALAPSETYDSGPAGGQGCWSGSAVDDNGTLTLIYTGHVDGRSPEEVQSLAVSVDGIVFNKPDQNPVIEDSPDRERFGFRDPKVWKRGELWYMAVGYGKDGLGKAIIYTSENLRVWTYRGAALESDGTMGDMWECPDLFPIGGGEHHALLISPMNTGSYKNLYVTGRFDYEACRLEKGYAELIDYGFDFYAPQTLLDDQGRRIMLAWMNIWGAVAPEQELGWYGAMTLPRELTLEADGTLRSRPVKELEVLRGEAVQASGIVLRDGEPAGVAGVAGQQLELIARIRPGDASEVGLRFFASADGEAYAEIVYDVAGGKLSMDRSRAGAGDGGVSVAPLSLLSDGTIELRLYLDRSSAELFANDGRIAMTNRIYGKADQTGISFVARGGEAELVSLDSWRLNGIWG